MLTDAGTLLARALVGGVFLIAGIAKLKARPGQFLNAILGYDLLPEPIATVLARGLPWLEVTAGGLLIAGLWTRFAAFLGAGLLLVFSGAVAICVEGSDPDVVRRKQDFVVSQSYGHG
ncbi:MAG: DoxX family protein [Chloroflexi bacterium]|nr:DoxX family protein [Chloroflexota bacterium]